jgi:hypothetical protein
MLYIILILILIGVAMWAVNQFIPMEPTFKRLVNVVIIILTIVWLIGAFGLIPGFRGLR